MKNLLDGLGDLGFGKLDDLEVFKENTSSNAATASNNKILTPEECLFEKSVKCTVCDKSFKTTSVVASKLRFVEIEEDLMPVHFPIFPFFYNMIVCPNCGYAAQPENFSKLSNSQCTLISNNITPKFKPKTYPLILTEEMVIERYKLALLNAVVKRARAGEKGYICLNISWAYKLKQDEANRKAFAEGAFDNFSEAYSKDTFPIYGMNEVVLAYLLSYLAHLSGKNDEAMKWAGRVLSTRNVSQRIKDLTIDLKDKLLKEHRE